MYKLDLEIYHYINQTDLTRVLAFKHNYMANMIFKNTKLSFIRPTQLKDQNDFYKSLSKHEDIQDTRVQI